MGSIDIRLLGIVLWALIPGFIAKKKGRNFWGYFFLSFLITPLITMIITLCVKSLNKVKPIDPVSISESLADNEPSPNEANEIQEVEPSAQEPQVTYMVQTIHGPMCLTPADIERLEKQGLLSELLGKTDSQQPSQKSSAGITDIESEISNTNSFERTTEQIIRFCRRCGFELIDGGIFCSRCGTRIEKGDVSNQV